MTELTIIGGGLAGSEAAWQAAERGLDVRDTGAGQKWGNRYNTRVKNNGILAIW